MILGGLYLEGLIHWGAYFRNFTVLQTWKWLRSFKRIQQSGALLIWTTMLRCELAAPRFIKEEKVFIIFHFFTIPWEAELLGYPARMIQQTKKAIVETWRSWTSYHKAQQPPRTRSKRQTLETRPGRQPGTAKNSFSWKTILHVANEM